MLTIDLIQRTVKPLAEKYNLVKVDLFGSYANGNATEKSDADFLLTFHNQPPSIFKVLGFKQELETLLNNPVDVVTLPLIRQDRLNIEKVINIYERA